MFYACKRKCALLAFLCALAAPNLAAATTPVENLLQDGLALLRETDYVGALEKFTAATKMDAADRRAWLFRGTAENRLGRHAAAFLSLERAQSLGLDFPRLDFEMGWSALNLGLWPSAIAHLKRYETARPGEAKTSEFLGRAYLRLGVYDQAEANLREAIDRDPNLKGTALYFLALVERARGDIPAAGEHLKELLREAPAAPLSRLLRERLARQAAATKKPWWVISSMSGGYNDNVLGLGKGIALPSDISSQSSGFGRFTLDGSYGWALAPTDTLTARYGFQAVIYGGTLSRFDLQTHYFSVDWRHAFTQDLAGAFRLSDQFTQIGGSSFLNQVGLRPSVGYRWISWGVAELAYTYTSSNYYFGSIPAQNRDGHAHIVTLDNYLAIPGSRLLTRLGYFFVRNESDGGDFEFDSHGILVELNHPLPWEITADILWTRTFNRYDNLNSLAGSTGFAFARKDDLDVVRVQLFRPITDWLKVFVRYDYINDDSNINFFNFNQNAYSAGVITQF